MCHYEPGLDGGRSDLPPDLEDAKANSQRKIAIWAAAKEIAKKSGGKWFDHITKACEVVFNDSGGNWDPPPTFGLETEWGDNQAQARKIVDEHIEFLKGPKQVQKKILQDMAVHRERSTARSRIERSR